MNDSGETRLLPLSQGKSAIVDAADYEWLSQWKWSLHRRGYATRLTGPKKKRVAILMHRFIMDTPAGMDTDHINGNKLDNRRCNLRVATRSQNNVNRGLLPNNRTGYKGVRIAEQTRRGMQWPAFIVVNDKPIGLGVYASPEEAARAFDHAARHHFGEFAYLNFPDLIDEPPPVPLERDEAIYLPKAGTDSRRAYDILLSRPGVSMTASEIASLAGINAGHTGKHLAYMAKRGLVEHIRTEYPARFRLAPTEVAKGESHE